MSAIIDGSNASSLPADSTINGVTVGKGGGSVASNTILGTNALILNSTGQYLTGVGSYALRTTTAGPNEAFGYGAMYSNTSGSSNAAFGFSALYNNSTGSSNTAIGRDSLLSNTIASYQTAVGYQALYTANRTSDVSGFNTAVGYQAGYLLTTGQFNCLIGPNAGNQLTTGSSNTFIGANGTSTAAGYYVTTGSKNTILGGYTGNQGGLDIRTASNYIVLSDGDGNPRITVDNNGGVGIGTVSPSAQGGYHLITAPGSVTTSGTVFLTMAGNATGTARSAYVGIADTGGQNGANSALWVTKVGATGRSISAAGTINALGTDYAEYMVKTGNFTINKGDICGIDVNGKLTNVFADAISFVVKSTNPSYVGGDRWGAKSEKDGDDYTQEELEQQRQLVDRIAFSGQVPVNVTGAIAGQYIIPINNNGAINGQAISNPTFEQYQISVGKVISVDLTGKPTIIVKVA